MADVKNPGNVTFDDTKPLLKIFDVSEKRLGRDNKGVLLRFTDRDTQTFAALTSKYSGKYLIVVASDDVMEMLHITAPIDDGYLGFKGPEEEPMAAYLRSKLFPNQ
jgi:hypothetical protein